MADRKVLFVGQLAPPVHGVSVMNDNILSSSLLNNEFRFIIVNLTTAKTLEDIGKQSAIKYFKFIKILISVFTKLLLYKIEFAYITLSVIGVGFIKDSLIVKLVKLFRVPVIIHLHGKGIDIAIQQGGERTKYSYDQVFSGSNVIVLSEALKQDIHNISSYKSCHVVNNGIQSNGHREIKREKSSPTVLLMLSNLVATKGSMDLLIATKILKEKSAKNFKVIFAGSWAEDSFQDEFTTFIKENELEDIVNVPGPVFGQEKEELLSTSDIFILPTYYPKECFPLSILEAMKHHLPVVSTCEGAIPEIIDEGKNGFLVESQNPEILADILIKLIDDEDLRKQMGRNACEKFNRLYTLDIFEKNLLDVFNKIKN